MVNGIEFQVEWIRVNGKTSPLDSNECLGRLIVFVEQQGRAHQCYSPNVLEDVSLGIVALVGRRID